MDDCNVAINGFYCERKDRLDKRAGGVACYFKHNLQYIIIIALENPSLEVIWIQIMPKLLPRKLSCIILACMYHPPGSDSGLMREHIINGIDSVARTHPECGVIVMGEFNHFKDNFIKTHYRYIQIVKGPTRWQSLLDKVWTNMYLVYDSPIILSELGSSDHNIVLLKPCYGNALDTGSRLRVTTRNMSSEKKARFA